MIELTLWGPTASLVMPFVSAVQSGSELGQGAEGVGPKPFGNRGISPSIGYVMMMAYSLLLK